MNQNDHQIFISYATPDQDRVVEVYDWLEREGFNPWISCRKIIPGQNWDFEIKRALDKSSLVIIFISHNSYNRRGYVQREIQLALDKMTEKLEDDIYIIPVLLDEGVELPEQLRSIQYISALESDFRERVVDAIRYQLNRLGAALRETQNRKDIYWSKSIQRETWDGLPGYEVELEVLKFQSTQYPNAFEIGDYIKGVLLAILFRHRAQKLSQSTDQYNHGQSHFRHTFLYDAHCRDPVITGSVITIQYTMNWYGAGAVHSNHHYETYAFLLDSLIPITHLKDIFTDQDAALGAIQKEVRRQLLEKNTKEPADEHRVILDVASVEAGTRDWGSFPAFIFNATGIELLFAPYKVGCYASGAHFAEVPYSLLVHILRPEYISALQLGRLVKSSNADRD